jgi:hypothetical protein
MEDGEEYIMRSFITRALHEILFARPSHGERNGQGM